MAFRKANREKLKLRMAICGPSGSGKSYTALRFAFALGDRVAAIDTENRSLSKYVGSNPDGRPFEFDVENLIDYNPANYVRAINDAGKAGYDVLVIDSLSHEWVGEGGCLEIKDRLGASQTNWSQVTPQHQSFLNALLHSPCHIIATIRSKTAWDYEKDEKTGKVIPIKLGLAPIQRSETEYEFDIFGMMDHAHVLRIEKSRCSAIQDKRVSYPGADFFRPVVEWLQTGAEAAPVPPPKDLGTGISQEQISRIDDLFGRLGFSIESVKKGLKANFGTEDITRLTEDQANELEAKLQTKLQTNGHAHGNGANGTMATQSTPAA